MNTTRCDDWEDQDGAGESDREAQTAWSRRALFGASGGLALAASGLLLPGWLGEEAAADKHPVRRVQGRKQKRRDKQRHKLKHNRRLKRRRKQNRQKTTRKDRPPGSDIFRDVAVVVHNYWSVPATVKGWQVRGDDATKYAIPAGWDSSVIPAFDEVQGTPSVKEFIGSEMDVAVQIGSGAVVRGQNFYLETPKAELFSGQWSSDGKNRTTKMLAQASLKINESISGTYQDNRVTIKATRVGDTARHIQFSVDLFEVMYLSVLVHNHRSVPVQVQGWQANQQGNAFEIPSGWDWSTIPGKAADGTHSTKEFVGNSRFVVVRIGTDRFVQGVIDTGPVNRAVSMWINTGGWNTNGWNPKGDTLTQYPHVAVNNGDQADGIKVTRIANGGDYYTGFRQQLLVELL